MRLQTVQEEGIRHGVALPGSTLDELRPHFEFDYEHPCKDLVSFLAINDAAQVVLCDMQSFHRMAYEAVVDAAIDGIVLLELRYAPGFCSVGHGHNWEQVLDAIQRGIEDGRKDAKTQYGRTIHTGLICIAVGAMGHALVDDTVDFLLEHRNSFVAFDMAGAEQDLLQFSGAFTRVHDAGIKITCHASEDKATGLPQNAVTAIEHLHASRIGHGIQIVQDEAIMDTVKASGALLEISVSSNFLTGAVPSFEHHPARRLYEHGIRISINTDDPGARG